MSIRDGLKGLAPIANKPEYRTMWALEIEHEPGRWELCSTVPSHPEPAQAPACIYFFEQQANEHRDFRNQHLKIPHRVVRVAVAGFDALRTEFESVANAMSEIVLRGEAAESRVAALESALQRIVDEGDYTAPEGMKRIAKEALITKATNP